MNGLIVSTFSSYGLSLQKDAFLYLKSAISTDSVDTASLKNCLNVIALAVVNAEIPPNISAFHLKPVLDDILSKQSSKAMVDGNHVQELEISDLNPYFQVLDIFDIPKFTFNHEKQLFYKEKQPKMKLGDAKSKIFSVRDRYDLIKQRLYRNDLYRPRKFQTQLTADHKTITPIKNLIGCHGNDFLLFGMLTQMQERKFHLEDSDGYVELIFSEETVKGKGIYTLNCFVLVEGFYNDEQKFLVNSISMPPLEAKTQITHGIDFFTGKDENQDLTELKGVQDIEGVSIVFASNIFLDKPLVFEKLRAMFEGYAETPPIAFVFLGSFISTPYNMDGSDQAKYTQSFNHLADVIQNYPTLQSTKFIFIPGQNDPWPSILIPSPPIPSSFTKRIRQKIPLSTFTTNPARIKYCAQEIVCFADGLEARMSRNAVFAETQERSGCIETILRQGCLSPLPGSVRPGGWQFEHCLRLVPAPDLLVVGDVGDPFYEDFEGCLAVVPGVFSNDFKFMYYTAHDKSINESQIPA